MILTLMAEEISVGATDNLPRSFVSSAVFTCRYEGCPSVLGNNSHITIQFQLWAVCSVHVCFESVSSKARTAGPKCPT